MAVFAALTNYESRCAMDDKFCLFEQWYHSQIPVWNRYGICLEHITYCDKAQCHHMILTLSTGEDAGVCELGLYESNQIYWVDITSGNVHAKEMFYRSNIPFVNTASIQDVVRQALRYMCQTGATKHPGG